MSRIRGQGVSPAQVVVTGDAVSAEAARDEAVAAAAASAGSAAAAAVSATNAADSATAADVSEAAAAGSATAAATSATNSANSAAAAAASATAADNSEAAAAGSAAAAAGSATNAANSATASATSATNSANSATASANSATASANAQAAAEGARDTAITQAGNAAASATAAAASAADAADSAAAAATFDPANYVAKAGDTMTGNLTGMRFISNTGSTFSFVGRGGGAGGAGAQFVWGWGNDQTTGITGEANSTWNIDVQGGANQSLLRVFSIDSGGVARIPITIEGTTGIITQSSTNFIGTQTFGASTVFNTNLRLGLFTTSGQFANIADDSAGRVMDFDFPNLATMAAQFRFFRNTNTTGSKSLEIFRGDGTGVLVDHSFYTGSSGTLARLARQGGSVIIGSTGTVDSGMGLDVRSGHMQVRSAAGNAGMYVSAPAASLAQLVFRDDNLVRWSVTRNATGDLAFQRHNAAGVYQANALSISNSTGVASFEQTPVAPTPAAGGADTQIPNVGYLRNIALPFTTPEMHGAVGNGSTNDRNALQAAIDTGKHVMLGAKEYRIDSAIVITGTGQRFEGGIIKPYGNFSAIQLNGAKGIHLDTHFRCDNQTGGYAVHVSNNSERCRIHRLHILDGGYNVLHVQQSNCIHVDYLYAINLRGTRGINWYGTDALRSDILNVMFASIAAAPGITTLVGIAWEGNCHSLFASDIHTVNCYHGLLVHNPGGGANYPQIGRLTAFATDFSYSNGIQIVTADDIDFHMPYINGAGYGGGPAAHGLLSDTLAGPGHIRVHGGKCIGNSGYGFASGQNGHLFVHGSKAYSNALGNSYQLHASSLIL